MSVSPLPNATTTFFTAAAKLLPSVPIACNRYSIKNEYTISSKNVPKITLHDLISKYSELYKRKNSIKVLSQESNLYSIEDGLKWLEKLFENKGKDWLFLFNFLPKIISRDIKYKSAVISLLLASLNKVSQGQIIMNKKQHYDKIMVKLKDG